MFIPFESILDQHCIPDKLSLSDGDHPHSLCILAVMELQDRLRGEYSWDHNFGLDERTDMAVIGKMFGVLIVDSPVHGIGYLAGFSGKLGGKNLHNQFVPPVFDLLTEGSFLNTGMQELTKMSNQIKLISESSISDVKRVAELKQARRLHSTALQKQIFEQYYLVNQEGREKSLTLIFEDAGYRSPPAGAGECAGIKLLQYAFLNQMRPLALAEFWWGKSPKSAGWKHGNYYACCKEKCEPILAHMLS